MGRSLCVQLKLMVNRLEFKIAFSIMLFIALASFALAACMEIFGEYTEVLDLRDANSNYLLNSCGQLWLAVKFLIPFLAVLPFATSYIGDRSSGYIGMYIGRVSYRNYLRSKLCACFIGGFILVFIPLIINLTLCNAAFVHNGSHYMGDIGSTILADNLTGRTLQYNTAYPALPLANLFVKSAFLYNLLYTFMFSGFIGLLSISALALSFFLRKYKILLFAPFFLLQRVFIALTNLLIRISPKSSRSSAMNFDLMDYFVPDTERGQNPIYALILILALCAFTYTAYRYILKRPLIGIQGD